MAPVWNERAPDRGVIAEGAAGSRVAGRLRPFRYEVRCWRDGRIPDVREAVDSPRRLTADAARAQRVLDLIRDVPTPVWGRDELGTGDMWDSNSVVSRAREAPPRAYAASRDRAPARLLSAPRHLIDSARLRRAGLLGSRTPVRGTRLDI